MKRAIGILAIVATVCAVVGMGIVDAQQWTWKGSSQGTTYWTGYNGAGGWSYYSYPSNSHGMYYNAYSRGSNFNTWYPGQWGMLFRR